MVNKEKHDKNDSNKWGYEELLRNERMYTRLLPPGVRWLIGLLGLCRGYIVLRPAEK